MVLSRKRVECSLWVGNEILPQVEEFKYLGVLFTSEGWMEREIDGRFGAASTVLRALHRPRCWNTCCRPELWLGSVEAQKTVMAASLAYTSNENKRHVQVCQYSQIRGIFRGIDEAKPGNGQPFEGRRNSSGSPQQHTIKRETVLHSKPAPFLQSQMSVSWITLDQLSNNSTISWQTSDNSSYPIALNAKLTVWKQS